jgi:hypothetical protein
MFLGAYDFAGTVSELLTAYDRLVASFPPGALQLHLCISGDDGITVFDACPTREIFESFSVSPEFRGAVESAGLPEPTVRALGDVHHVIASADAS